MTPAEILAAIAALEPEIATVVGPAFADLVQDALNTVKNIVGGSVTPPASNQAAQDIHDTAVAVMTAEEMK